MGTSARDAHPSAWHARVVITLGVESRGLRGLDDFWPVRDFLAALYAITPPGVVWDVRRWDGSIWHSDPPGLAPDRAERSRLWVAPGGGIVAAAMSEGGRQIHPHVHPAFGHLLGHVVAWSEEAAAVAGDDRVLLHVWDHDEATRRIAVERGYQQSTGWEVLRSLRLGTAALPAPVVQHGYTVRSTGREADDQAIADLLNAAFRRSVHVAAELTNFHRWAPSFRRELDLVADPGDGTLAAYAAVCWDSWNRRAVFEPVCTHPDHRRRGLAKALMLEGMRRARDLGAEVVDVGTGDMDPANALYASLPFTETYRGRYWEKAL